MKLKDKLIQVLGARKILLENRHDSETSTTRESGADVDVDLKISSFWLHEAWFPKNVWERKKPELKKHNYQCRRRDLLIKRIMVVQLGSL